MVSCYNPLCWWYLCMIFRGIAVGFNWCEPEWAINGTAVCKLYLFTHLYYYYYDTYVRHPHGALYIVYAVRDIHVFQHQLRGRMKELLRVRYRGATSTGSRRLHKVMLEEDGAIGQSVSVSEDKRDRPLQRRWKPFVHQWLAAETKLYQVSL